jgi:hypothetical protein
MTRVTIPRHRSQNPRICVSPNFEFTDTYVTFGGNAWEVSKGHVCSTLPLIIKRFTRFC